jgi:hypothetical protein
MNMPNVEVLSQAFPARIRGVEALIAASQSRTDNAAQLRQAAVDLDYAGPQFGRASTAVAYAAFAELLRTAAMLVEWRTALLNAEIEANRYLRGAKERHRLWLTEFPPTEASARLIGASDGIEAIELIEDLKGLFKRIASTPLPIGVYADERPFSRTRQSEGQKGDKAEEPPEPPELAIAFLSFLIDNVPAGETHFLTPGEAHDLAIEVRVSRWPETAVGLRLSPVSIESKSTYDFPSFEFLRPTGNPPFVMQQRGRAVLNAPQSLYARPFEFKYMASFTPAIAEQPVAVVGQRTLLIEGFDLSRTPITGYRDIDRKILTIRDKLRVQPWITAGDLDGVLNIVASLGNLAGRALQDALFKKTCKEADFQAEVRNDLRRNPMIGPKLEEHPRATGGITDLSLQGVRIELKYDDSKNLVVKDCQPFVDQTVSYTVGTGKRVGVLCVLDNSPKQSPPFPAEEGIEILSRSTQDGEVCIVTVLIQGNLARPSDHSR